MSNQICVINKLRAVRGMLREFWAHITFFLAWVGWTESLYKHKIHETQHGDCGLYKRQLVIFVKFYHEKIRDAS